MSTKKTKVQRAARTARAKQPAKGRRFTPEDKKRAVEFVAAGRKRAEVATEIGTSVASIRRWEATKGETITPSASVSSGENSHHWARSRGWASRSRPC